MKGYYHHEIARLTDLNSAALFSHIQFWCDLNKQKNTNVINDKAWTKQSFKQIESRIPLSYKQIRTSIEKLEKKGLIERRSMDNSGIYFFSITDKALSVIGVTPTPAQMGRPPAQMGKLYIRNKNNNKKCGTHAVKTNSSNWRLAIAFSTKFADLFSKHNEIKTPDIEQWANLVYKRLNENENALTEFSVIYCMFEDFYSNSAVFKDEYFLRATKSIPFLFENKKDGTLRYADLLTEGRRYIQSKPSKIRKFIRKMEKEFCN